MGEGTIEKNEHGLVPCKLCTPDRCRCAEPVSEGIRAYYRQVRKEIQEGRERGLRNGLAE